MRGLLKFPLLTFALCLNLFSGDSEGIDYIKKHYSNCTNNGYLVQPPHASSISHAQPEFLQDNYLKIGNDVFEIGNTDYMCFNVSFLNDSGYFLAYYNKDSFGLFNYSPDFSSTKISCILNPDGKVNRCAPFGSDEDKKRARDVEFSYYTETSLSKVKTCEPGENFNTNTKQCQSCPAGQSWDPETNTCFNDCRKDGKINKFAFTDGSCIDCSGEKNALSVLQCICRGYGNSSIDPKIWGKNGGSPDGCQLEGSCGDGSIQHSFTNPNCKPDNDPDPKPDPKPDENKTKPDPKPDDPKPDPDNPNPGGDSGGGNSGGGGNNGGSQNNPNPGDSPNPNPNPNPGGGGGGSGDNVKFKEGDFKYDDLKSGENDFTSKYSQAISDVTKNFHTFKNGVDQFIENVKGNGLNDISKKDIPKTCSRKETIDFFGHNIEIDFDFCKIVAPSSGAFYYLFYVFFFGCFLFLIIKLLILSF